MTEKITTPAGYQYDEPETTGKPHVNVSLTYEDAYGILLDGIQSEATVEPLTVETFKALAENLLGLLIDASEDARADATVGTEAPRVSLYDYIRRDLAYTHGIDRDHLAELDKTPKHERPATQRQWDIYARAAEIGATDWIIGNAPGTIPHLREAGLYVPDIYPEYPETPKP